MTQIERSRTRRAGTSHLAEMQYLVNHGCKTLEEARQGLARERWQYAQRALAHVQNAQPLWIGVDHASRSDRHVEAEVTSGPYFWWKEADR